MLEAAGALGAGGLDAADRDDLAAEGELRGAGGARRASDVRSHWMTTLLFESDW